MCGAMQQVLAEVNLQRPFLFDFPVEGEKAGEEREKDREKREETEATDARDKSEAADVKKGASH